MKNIILLLISFSICKNSFSQDYTNYYNTVNHAEEQIFVNGQISDGLKTYVSIFEKYDFVFLGDCITALQIALYANDEKTFLTIVTKATQNGLMPRHFDYIMMKYIRNHPLYIKNKDKIKSIYQTNRVHYLKRIDTLTAYKVIRLYAYDQLSKNYQYSSSGKLQDRETPQHYKHRYAPLIQETMNDLMSIIAKKGIPADKIIGVDQNDIMSELKMGKFDAVDYYNSNQNDNRYYADRSQFFYDEYFFSSTMYLFIIDHYVQVLGQRFAGKGYLLHTDEFYLKQIKMGNMHPRDIAYLYDYPWRWFNPKRPDTTKGEKYFHTYLIPYDNTDGGISIKEIDHFRAMFFLPSLENDWVKYKFLQEHEMFAGTGSPI